MRFVTSNKFGLTSNVKTDTAKATDPAEWSEAEEEVAGHRLSEVSLYALRLRWPHYRKQIRSRQYPQEELGLND